MDSAKVYCTNRKKWMHFYILVFAIIKEVGALRLLNNILPLSQTPTSKCIMDMKKVEKLKI